MIAILVAVTQELRPILRRADANHVVRQEHLDFHEGTLAGQPVALLALGVGKECARIAAEITIKCYRPDLVISAGFGGALQNAIRHGDIVIGTEALELHHDQQLQTRWAAPSHVPVPAETNHRIHRGKVLTADDMILRAATKRQIGRTTGGLTVDMETSAVAAVCAARHTSFLPIRCISDTVTDDLPEEFNDFFIVGQLQLSRVFSACNRDPRVIIDLARLGYRAQVAGNNLADFLARTLPNLKPLQAAAA